MNKKIVWLKKRPGLVMLITGCFFMFSPLLYQGIIALPYLMDNVNGFFSRWEARAFFVGLSLMVMSIFFSWGEGID
jgi:hypothetical protein